MILATPVIWLVFSFQYAHRNRSYLTQPRFIALLSVVPVIITLLCWTNDSHHLIWPAWHLETDGPVTVLVVEHGLVFWAYTAYSYLLILAGTWAVLQTLGRVANAEIYRRQAITLILAVSAPWIGNLFYLTGFNPLPGFDLTPLAVAASCLLFAWALFRYHFLEIGPIARDTLIENMPDLLAVVDDQDYVVDVNPAMARRLGRPAPKLIGQPAPEVFGGWPELLERLRANPEAPSEILSNEGGEQHYYDVRLIALRERQYRLSGRLIAARDITQSRLLEQARKRQALIFETISDSVILTDQSGNVVDCNPATERLLGYPRAEIIGQNASLWQRPAEAEMNQMFIRTGLQENGRWFGEINFVRKDGSEGIIEIMIVPLLEDNGQRFIAMGVGREITERRRAETTLKTQKELFENLVAVARATAERPTLEATLRNALRVAVTLTGADTSTLLLLDPQGNVTHSVLTRGRTELTERRRIVREVMERGFAGWLLRERRLALIEDTFQDDRWLTLPNQPYITRSVLGLPIISSDTVVGLLTLQHPAPNHFTQDHANLMQAAGDQLALALRNAQIYDAQRRQAERQATLYQVLSTVGAQLDPQVVLQSAVATVGRLTNWPFVAVLLAEGEALYVSEVSTTLNHMLTQHHFVQQGIASRALRTGQTQWVRDVATDPDYVVYASAVRSELDVPLKRGNRTLGVFDIQHTERDAFDEDDVLLATSLGEAIALALDNALLYKESLETAQRLRELDKLKSAFVANMSHELRTPLHSILGYTEVLLQESMERGYTDLAPDLRRVNTSATHLLTLINNVLDFSKIEAGRLQIEPEWFEITSLIDSAVASVQPVINKNGNILTTRVAPEANKLYADPVRVRQVLINLLGNAAKFTRKGSIDLSVSRELTDGGEWMCFAVKDTGIGLTPEQIGSLFQEFTQADSSTTRKYGGTGLGLALSQRLCHLMGGEIQVVSPPNQGLTFTPRLPAADHTPDDAPALSAQLKAPISIN